MKDRDVIDRYGLESIINSTINDVVDSVNNPGSDEVQCFIEEHILSENELESMKNNKPGVAFNFRRLILIKTVNNQILEVDAYVRQLEKTVIRQQKQQKDIENISFKQYLKSLYRRFFKK